MEILQSNGWSLIAQFGLLIVAIIGTYRTTRRAYDKKESDTQQKIELKADKTMVHTVSEEVKKKADVAYVDKETRATHHRINGIEKRSDANIQSLHADVKEILKILAGKKQ